MGARKSPARVRAQGSSSSATRSHMKRTRQRALSAGRAFVSSSNWSQGRDMAGVRRGLAIYFWIFCFPARCAENHRLHLVDAFTT